MTSSIYSGVTFHHNSGLEGDLLIEYGSEGIVIPAEAVVALVAFAYVLPRKVARLEAITEPDDLLLGRPVDE